MRAVESRRTARAGGCRGARPVGPIAADRAREQLQGASWAVVAWRTRIVVQGRDAGLAAEVARWTIAAVCQLGASRVGPVGPPWARSRLVLALGAVVTGWTEQLLAGAVEAVVAGVAGGARSLCSGASGRVATVWASARDSGSGLTVEAGRAEVVGVAASGGASSSARGDVNRAGELCSSP